MGKALLDSGEPGVVAEVAAVVVADQDPLRGIQEPYDELGEDYFTRRADPERETRRLIAKLEALGHRVILEEAA